MNNELVRDVSDALARCIAMNIERDVQATDLLPSEREVIARAVIPVVLERAAKVADEQKWMQFIVDDSMRNGDSGPLIFNEACDTCAAAIRGLGE